MTWQELLNEGEKRLSKKGVPEAKLNAWYLFSDCFEIRSWRLKVRKPNVFLH